jgi:hypothetical protein
MGEMTPSSRVEGTARRCRVEKRRNALHAFHRATSTSHPPSLRRLNEPVLTFFLFSLSLAKQQRIEGYEASTTPLNADQQRAIAGKPVLEAVIKELNEVREVLKVRFAFPSSAVLLTRAGS